MVYNEMLSFNGCEVYFYEAEWNGVSFAELSFHFIDGITLGVYKEDDGVVLRPGDDYALQDKDQVIILAEDDSTVNFETTALTQSKSIELSTLKLEQKQKKVLILGWHSVAEIFIRESADYLSEGTQFDILFNEPNQYLKDKVAELTDRYEDFTINLQNADPLKFEALKEIDPFSYANVIILSQELDEHRPDKIDSDTLIILLWLRKVKESVEDVQTKIITQVPNSENQEIITQTDVDDFIISNKLITMILAQLSEEPLIKLLYDDLFSEDVSETYVKPANLYFTSYPQKVRFAYLIAIAGAREDVCLGIRKGDLSKDPDSNFGVKLNLPKTAEVEINEDDYLVVLSEDEL